MLHVRDAPARHQSAVRPSVGKAASVHAAAGVLRTRHLRAVPAQEPALPVVLPVLPDLERAVGVTEGRVEAAAFVFEDGDREDWW